MCNQSRLHVHWKRVSDRFTMSESSPESSSRTSLESYASISVEDLLSLSNLKVLEVNDQIRELQTIIRDKWADPIENLQLT